MAIALVTGNAIATENDAAGTSLNAPAFPNNISTNNLLIAACTWASDGTLDDATITDSAGNTWIRTETGPTYDAGNGQGATVYYSVISAGGGTKPTVTANFWTTTAHSVAKSVTYRSVHVSEFSGTVTASVLDKHGTNAQTTSATPDGIFAPAATVTPVSDGQLIYGLTVQSGGANGNSAFLTAGTGYTELVKVATVSPAGYFYETEYKIQSVAAAVQATWSQPGISTSSVVINLMATFKAAAGDTLHAASVF